MKPIIDALKKLAVDAVMKSLIAEMPIIASSFVNPIMAWIVGLVVDVLYDKAALGINWMWIIVDNDLELKATLKTKDKLYAILQAGGDHAKAEKAFNEATDDLIHNEFGRLPR